MKISSLIKKVSYKVITANIYKDLLIDAERALLEETDVENAYIEIKDVKKVKDFPSILDNLDLGGRYRAGIYDNSTDKKIGDFYFDVEIFETEPKGKFQNIDWKIKNIEFKEK